MAVFEVIDQNFVIMMTLQPSFEACVPWVSLWHKQWPTPKNFRKGAGEENGCCEIKPLDTSHFERGVVALSVSKKSYAHIDWTPWIKVKIEDKWRNSLWYILFLRTIYFLFYSHFFFRASEGFRVEDLQKKRKRSFYLDGLRIRWRCVTFFESHLGLRRKSVAQLRVVLIELGENRWQRLTVRQPEASIELKSGKSFFEREMHMA